MYAYFTVQEANQALPQVRPLATALMRWHHAILKRSNEVKSVLDKSRWDSGSLAAGELVLLFEQYERTMKQLQKLGVQMKDPASGLCDFPSRHQERDILLCWKVGEADVEWWHELESGFNGRRHVSEL